MEGFEDTLEDAVPDGLETFFERVQHARRSTRHTSRGVELGAELVLHFEGGDLGLTLQRTDDGNAMVIRVYEDKQAQDLGVQSGDTIVRVGELDVGGRELGDSDWATLVQALKSAPRPLQVTFFRALSEDQVHMHEASPRSTFRPRRERWATATAATRPPKMAAAAAAPGTAARPRAWRQAPRPFGKSKKDKEKKKDLKI